MLATQPLGGAFEQSLAIELTKQLHLSYDIKCQDYLHRRNVSDKDSFQEILFKKKITPRKKKTMYQYLQEH